MNRCKKPSSQRGVALAFALILMTVVTVIGVFAASTGSLELRMARNMQDSLDSFQAAEAGIQALVALVRTGPNPFEGEDNADPFDGVDPNPLALLNDGADSVEVEVVLLLRDATCPRSIDGFSVDLLACDHYRVESLHDTPDARTQLNEGVAKPVIGSTSL
jgi:type IV pilus assembly protein PilX